MPRALDIVIVERNTREADLLKEALDKASLLG